MNNVVEFSAEEAARERPDTPAPAYAELAVSTNFSFLRGASHAQDLVRQAVFLGLAGIGIADRNSVAGVVRAYGAAEDLNEHSWCRRVSHVQKRTTPTCNMVLFSTIAARHV